MPQIVIIIDELATVLVAPARWRTPSAVAQWRRGGHPLVIATQRPSVDVVTGLIKANFPARIAFAVTSQIDSRVILDVPGAERLLGRGDMLFAPAGTNKPARVQGAWVSDDEVGGIVSYIKVRHETTYDSDVIEHLENARCRREKETPARRTTTSCAGVDDGDRAGQASTSMIQRRLRVGYARAGSAIDELEKRGFIGPADGAKPRSVLISREQYNSVRRYVRNLC